MPRMLTVEEAAHRLRVKPITMREYLRKGRVPGRKIGKKWLIVETDLESFILSDSPSRSTRTSARGMLSHLKEFSSETFMDEKHAENELEEAEQGLPGHDGSSPGGTPA